MRVERVPRAGANVTCVCPRPLHAVGHLNIDGATTDTGAASSAREHVVLLTTTKDHWSFSCTIHISDQKMVKFADTSSNIVQKRDAQTSTVGKQASYE